MFKNLQTKHSPICKTGLSQGNMLVFGQVEIKTEFSVLTFFVIVSGYFEPSRFRGLVDNRFEAFTFYFDKIPKQPMSNQDIYL